MHDQNEIIFMKLIFLLEKSFVEKKKNKMTYFIFSYNFDQPNIEPNKSDYQNIIRGFHLKFLSTINYTIYIKLKIFFIYIHI